MAKKDTGNVQAAPKAPSIPRQRSPLLAFLIVLLVLVGIGDILLWGMAGYYFVQEIRDGHSAGITQSSASSGAAAGGEDSEKQEALLAYLQEMSEVGNLENEMRESNASVVGENYTDDAAMYAEISEHTLPLCRQIDEKTAAIVPSDPEILQLHEIYRDYVTKCLNGFNMLTSALEDQDAAKADEANTLINETVDLGTNFQQVLRSLAEERGVTLNS